MSIKKPFVQFTIIMGDIKKLIPLREDVPKHYKQ